MTGHLVLSTLHTNSAGETAARLVEKGADPLTLSDALLGVLAQRLAQRLCGKCDAPVAEYTRAELEELAAEYLHSGRNGQASAADRDALIRCWKAGLGNGGAITRWAAKGCDACSGTGYRGRVGLFVCPVLLHSSNTDRVYSMHNELRFADWMVDRVGPIGADWIETTRLRRARELVAQHPNT